MDQGFLVHTVYSALYTCALLTWTPRLLWHALRGGPATAGLGQRLGQVPPACRSLSGGAIWIHAVSVGEVHAARGLLPHLRRLLGGPVVISTTTPTGQALATESGADSHCYMPLDLDWALKPFFRALRPRLLILVETELWPNLLKACRQRHIPVALVNGRLSRTSFKRYQRLGGLWEQLLGSVSLVCTRTAVEADRFKRLGLPAERLFVTGNLKGDAAALQPAESLRRALARALGISADTPLLVAGCTMPDEEMLVLRSFRSVRDRFPDARLLLAPRHPERFPQVAEAIHAAGFRCCRRSQPVADPTEVILLDSMGELPAAYGLGIASFVGGSLVQGGGHNVLEPAIHGQPVLFGPHMENFAALASKFIAANAARVVRDADDLTAAWCQLLESPALRKKMGRNARDLALRDATAGRRTARLLASRLARMPM